MPTINKTRPDIKNILCDQILSDIYQVTISHISEGRFAIVPNIANTLPSFSEGIIFCNTAEKRE